MNSQIGRKYPKAPYRSCHDCRVHQDAGHDEGLENRAIHEAVDFLAKRWKLIDVLDREETLPLVEFILAVHPSLLRRRHEEVRPTVLTLHFVEIVDDDGHLHNACNMCPNTSGSSISTSIREFGTQYR